MHRVIKSLFRKGEANITKILCLAIGLAFGLTMLSEVIYERSYDNFVPGLEDTYLVGENFKMKGEDWKDFSQCSGAHAPGIKSVCPEVEAATRYTWISESATFVTEDKTELKGNVFLCDSSFFDIFPRKILLGEDPKTGLNESGKAYISESLYKTIGKDIIGKIVSLKTDNRLQLNIVGVFQNIPENTSLPDMDIMMAMPTALKIWGWDSPNNVIGNDRYLGYVRLRHGTNPDDLQGRMDQWINEKAGKQLTDSGVDMKLRLDPLKGIVLQSSKNRTMNFAFLGFGIIMLLVSVFNYILLIISSMVNRAKSIATYRCYGADSKDIYKMILAESFLHIFCIALPLAVLIIFGLQNFVQEQIQHSLKSLFPLSTIIICLLITLVIIIVCGLLPGYIYTKIPITYAYRKYTENKRNWKLTLLFVQFMLTGFFVCLLTVIGLQYQKLTNYDLGFNYKNMLEVKLKGVNKNERERCYQELKRNPNVASITWAYQDFSSSVSGDNVFNPETGEQYMNVRDLFSGGDDFFKTFEIPVLEGKTFTPVAVDSLSREVMVSENFVKKMEELAGWKGDAIGKDVYVTSHDGPYRIIGIYKDFRTGILEKEAEEYHTRPSVIYYGTIDSPGIMWLYIRLNNMGSEEVRQIQDTVDKTMTGNKPTVYLLNMEIGNNYAQLKHVRNSVMLAGASILVITLIGLIAYIRDEVNRRRSEIAIRSILGATAGDIQRLFQQYLLYIAVPAILAGGLSAWIVGQHILEIFSVKIPLTWYLFGGCMLTVLIIILALAYFLVQKAIQVNPTENLRTE